MDKRETRAVDVVVLTAIRPEYEAARKFLQRIRKVEHVKGTIYEMGIFPTRAYRGIRVAIAEVGIGNQHAATEAERAISCFNPRIAFVVGVAGGLKDVKLLDVVAATKVYGYEFGKAGEYFLPRPEIGASSYRLIQIARYVSRRQEWRKRIRAPFPALDSVPEVYVGPIAAGEKVVASTVSPTYRFLRKQYSDALAVEMEGIGAMAAVHANHPVTALIVRGISDMIDGKSDSDGAGSQELAARNAAAFAFEVLATLNSKAMAKPNLSGDSGTYFLRLEAERGDIGSKRLGNIVRTLKNITRDPRLRFDHISDGSVCLEFIGSRAGFERARKWHQVGKLSEALSEKVMELNWVTARSHRRTSDFETVSEPPGRTPGRDLGRKAGSGKCGDSELSARVFLETEKGSRDNRFHTRSELRVVMNVDIENSTQILEEWGDPEYYSLRDDLMCRVTELVRDKMFGGDIVKFTGDGLYATFSKSSDAVRCGLEIQANAKRESILPLRMGMALGTVTLHYREGNPFEIDGLVAYKAERIQGLGKGGHILVSESVWRDAKAHMKNYTVNWKCHGSRPLKGFQDSEIIYECSVPDANPLSDLKVVQDGGWGTTCSTCTPSVKDNAIDIALDEDRPSSPVADSRNGANAWNKADLERLSESGRGEELSNSCDQAGYMLNSVSSDLIRLRDLRISREEWVTEVRRLANKLLTIMDQPPSQMQSLWDCVTAFYDDVEDALAATKGPFARVIRHLLDKVLEKARHSGFSDSPCECLNPDRVGKSSAEDFFAPTEELTLSQAVDFLLSGDELKEAAGLHRFMQEKPDRVCQHVSADLPTRQTEQVLEVLWKRLIRVFLHYDRTAFRAVCELLRKHNPGRWEDKLRFLRQSIIGAVSSNEAEISLAESSQNDQEVLASFMTVGRASEVRKVGMRIFSIDGRWDVLVNERTRLRIIRELVQDTVRRARQIHSFKDDMNDYVKALLLVMKDRVTGAKSLLELADAYDILRAFYDYPALLEDTFFEELVELHNTLRAKAHDAYGADGLERNMNAEFLEMIDREHFPDSDVGSLERVPLPIQRKLARDGYFPEVFILSPRHEIALEAIPHILPTLNVGYYLHVKSINPVALNRLAENKELMNNRENRFAFCSHPKAKPALVRQYIQRLSRPQLASLIRNRGATADARRAAKEYLSRLTKKH